MVLFRHLILFIFLVTPSIVAAEAVHHKQDFFRDFLSPTYHIERLNYCMLDGKECGLSVADQFCKIMGYEEAVKAIIDNNVGLTNYLLTRAQCKGWRCNGFKIITCKKRFSHQPAKYYQYRSERFVFPRIDHYRVDWCYDNGKECGHRAAHSFCRKMGYMRARDYKIQEHVPATKALGDQKLCFGKLCNGFSDITCYR